MGSYVAPMPSPQPTTPQPSVAQPTYQPQIQKAQPLSEASPALAISQQGPAQTVIDKDRPMISVPTHGPVYKSVYQPGVTQPHRTGLYGPAASYAGRPTFQIPHMTASGQYVYDAP